MAQKMNADFAKWMQGKAIVKVWKESRLNYLNLNNLKLILENWYVKLNACWYTRFSYICYRKILWGGRIKYGGSFCKNINSLA